MQKKYVLFLRLKNIVHTNNPLVYTGVEFQAAHHTNFAMEILDSTTLRNKEISVLRWSPNFTRTFLEYFQEHEEGNKKIQEEIVEKQVCLEFYSTGVCSKTGNECPFLHPTTNHLKEELSKQRAEIENLRLDNERLRDDFAQAAKDRAALKKQTEKLGTYKDNEAKLLQKLKQAREDLKLVREEAKDNGAIQASEVTSSELRKMLLDARIEVKQLRTDSKEATKKLTETKIQLATVQEALQEKQKEVKSKQKIINSMKEALKKKARQNDNRVNGGKGGRWGKARSKGGRWRKTRSKGRRWGKARSKGRSQSRTRYRTKSN